MINIWFLPSKSRVITLSTFSSPSAISIALPKLENCKIKKNLFFMMRKYDAQYLMSPLSLSFAEVLHLIYALCNKLFLWNSKKIQVSEMVWRLFRTLKLRNCSFNLGLFPKSYCILETNFLPYARYSSGVFLKSLHTVPPACSSSAII